MDETNAFLISVDGLRADRLSYAGYDRETTPNVDALAADGSVCRTTIATGPGTRTSFPGILTSSYPLMYGGYAQLTDHRVPLSTVFDDHGYVTLGVNTNAQLHTRFGWDRGYDVYYDSEQTTVNEPVGSFPRTTSEEGDNDDTSFFGRQFETLKTQAYQRLDQDSALYRLLERGYRQVSGRDPPHDSAERTVDRTLSFLDRVPDDEPVFCWMHFMETHSPYFPPETYRSEYLTVDVSDDRIWRLNDWLHTDPDRLDEEDVQVISDLYDASLSYFDDELGRLFDGMRGRGYFEEANIAFTADHGEEFREHGALTHCTGLYDEGVHVPMVYRLGGKSTDDVETITSTIDIGPTLLDASVDDPDVPDPYHGLSLYPALTGEDVLPDDRVVFSQHASSGGRDIELESCITGCRSDDWKYITSLQPSIEDQLYDLRGDPGEQDNVVSDNSDKVRAFEKRIDDHYDQPAYTDYDIVDATDTGEVTDQLEALGYMQE